MSSSQQEDLFGAPFIGAIFYMFLFGVATTQVYLFFRFNSQVYFLNKGAVIVLWIMALLDICFLFHYLFHYLVVNRSDGTMIWSFNAQLTMNFLLMNLAQWSYTLRLWQVLSVQRKLRLVLCACLSLLILENLAFCIYISSHMHVGDGFATLASVRTYMIIVLINSIIIDLIISLSLMYGLSKFGNKLGWTDSNFIFIVAYMVNTGALATLFCVSSFIPYLVKSLTGAKENNECITFKIIHTGLYLNSFLAMMNARHYFQRSDSNEPPREPISVIPPTLPTGRRSGNYASSDLRNHFGPSRRDETINEAGLPLFKPAANVHLVQEEFKMLEIKVDTERVRE
ncbi:hypothetical protein Moror_1929 [Moniliophthora roreri MCA 2997]|uniref:DUF6534 domain-containing protein n=1 Tax=Moniliophthora roreri (strain MCA 2997) TaxID=1381753 RepID=V2X5B0_MONRO|nr:hypothetical protein Moror_1929 [Moniliophthora roreri MCA 2997]